MRIVKKYLWYKRILQGLFVLNIFFILCGVVALFQYFKTHDVTTLALVFVGLGTLTFGFVIPGFLVGRIMAIMQEMHRQTEEKLARVLAVWVESFKKSDDPLRDPHFWINVALLMVEVFGENLEHPLARIVVDFAPFLKAEVQRSSKKGRSRKSAA